VLTRHSDQGFKAFHARHFVPFQSADNVAGLLRVPTARQLVTFEHDTEVIGRRLLADVKTLGRPSAAFILLA
jgi:hypothetical protein